MKILLYLINMIGDSLPIESGLGNATIDEQLIFWSESLVLFDSTLKRRKVATDLDSKRESFILRKWSLNQELISIHDQQRFIGKNFVYKVSFPLRIVSLNKREKSLYEEIEKIKIFLNETEEEFQDDKLNLKKITSRIDCKLPTVVAGHFLQDLDWEVTMLCANYPVHPSILVSKKDSDGKENKFLIDFGSNESKFRAEPNIKKYNPRYISGSRLFAVKKGFISKEDPWPLPFGEETFKRFDDWYVKEVREKEEEVPT